VEFPLFSIEKGNQTSSLDYVRPVCSLGSLKSRDVWYSFCRHVSKTAASRFHGLRSSDVRISCSHCDEFLNDFYV